jgi:hypothetical protein
VLMTVALAVSVRALVSGVYRQSSLVQKGLPPSYLLIPRLVLAVAW